MNSPSRLRMSKTHRAVVSEQRGNRFYEYVLSLSTAHCRDVQSFGRAVSEVVPTDRLIQSTCQEDRMSQTFVAKLRVRGEFDFFGKKGIQVVSMKRIQKPELPKAR